MIVGQGRSFVERVIKRAVDCFLDFRATEILGGTGVGIEIKCFGIASAPGEVDREYIAALLDLREIDKENLVEASFAEQFGR